MRKRRAICYGKELPCVLAAIIESRKRGNKWNFLCKKEVERTGLCVSFRLNKAAVASVIPCPLHRNFIVPAVNAESTRPIQSNSLTRTGIDRCEMHFGPTRKPYRARYTAVHVRQTVSLWSAASCSWNLHVVPVFATFCSIRSKCSLSLSLSQPIRVYILLVSVFPFLSSSLFSLHPSLVFFHVEWNERPHSHRCHYHGVIILTTFVASTAIRKLWTSL